MERRRTVFDANFCDGICDHGEYVIVVWVDLVRNVAVNEDIAWTRSSYDTFWDARVRASEPEDLSVCSRRKEPVSIKYNAKGRTMSPPTTPPSPHVEEERS